LVIEEPTTSAVDLGWSRLQERVYPAISTLAALLLSLGKPAPTRDKSTHSTQSLRQTDRACKNLPMGARAPGEAKSAKRCHVFAST